MSGASLELKALTLRILCSCGKSFLAEDLESECPYCERRYAVRLRGDPRKVEFEVDLARP